MDEETVALEPEGTELTPPATGEGVVTIESLHAMVLEIQGQLANLQTIADQATPVEPEAEEPAEEPAADDAALLEEEPAAEVAEEDVEEIDALLNAN